jgi:hypothetical protein
MPTCNPLIAIPLDHLALIALCYVLPSHLVVLFFAYKFRNIAFPATFLTATSVVICVARIVFIIGLFNCCAVTLGAVTELGHGVFSLIGANRSHPFEQ